MTEVVVQNLVSGLTEPLDSTDGREALIRNLSDKRTMREGLNVKKGKDEQRSVLFAVW